MDLSHYHSTQSVHALSSCRPLYTMGGGCEWDGDGKEIINEHVISIKQ